MRANYFLLFLLVLFVQTNLFAQATQLKAKTASSYVGKPVYVYAITDEFSGFKKLLGKTTVSADSSFSLALNVDYTGRATISIDRVNTSLYLEPGANLDVYFPALSSKEIRVFNNTNTVDLIFENLEPTNLNRLVSEFYNEFDDFINTNLNTVFSKTFRPKLYQFRAHCDSTYSKTPYLKNLISYAFAITDKDAGLKAKPAFEKYLANNTIDIHNLECANFIQEYFELVILDLERFTKEKPLTSALIQSKSTASILAEFAKSDFLKSDTLRELVALNAIAAIYNDRDYSKATLIRVIQEIGQQSKIKMNQEVAKNFVAALKQFEQGTPAYNFSLVDRKGKSKNLNAFANKPTLLVIWSTWSEAAFTELKLLETLYAPYESKLNLVNISIDDNVFEFENFIAQNPKLKGEFLNYYNDKYLIEGLGVVSVPQFILIDSKGNYVNQYAPSPSKDLDAYLTSYFEKLK